MNSDIILGERIMRIKNGGCSSPCYDRRFFSSLQLGNSEKADNAISKLQHISRSGSEEARWDKVQDWLKKDGITLIYRVTVLTAKPTAAVVK